MVSVLRTSQYYDIDALAADVSTARRILDFGAGAYEHSISLPDESDISADHRTHKNNNPYAGALGSCPLFAEIFNSFQSKKAGYRLLRRNAGTAYSLHDDKDVDDALVRMQMPVVTNRSALLLVQKDGAELEPIARKVDEFTHNDDLPITFDYSRFAHDFGEWFDAFLLEPGFFHLIDPTRVHTLINAGDAERVTLCIDMLRDDWLDGWLSEHMSEEVQALPADSLPEGTWEWGALRHGLLTHPRIHLT
jgi:hypothetical protein